MTQQELFEEATREAARALLMFWQLHEAFVRRFA
jgi:hypothetical protein